MKFVHKLLLSALLLSVGCSQGAPDGAPNETGTQVNLTVFAASSLSEVFGEIGEAFEADNPQVRILFNFAGSSQLAQQIAQEAPADVFASANLEQMEVAQSVDRIDPAAVEEMAYNQLVVIYPADNPANLHDLTDLAQPGLKLIIAAGEVPVGAYSLEFLQRASQDPAYGPEYTERVLQNVVSYEENVKAVLSKISLGEADAGIVYASDIPISQSSRVGQIAIPLPLNPRAAYYLAPLANADHPALAQEFVDFVLSETGQAVLERHQMIPVRP